MPVRVALQIMGSPERLPLRDVKPGGQPFVLHDYTSGSGLVIAAACRAKNRCGEIYHIPDEQLDGSPDSEGVPDELLTDGNLHTTIALGRSYERPVTMHGGADIVRFIFTHFR